MATDFPGGLDAFTPNRVIDLEDALKAVETKLGVDGSTNAASVDRKLASVVVKTQGAHAVADQAGWDPNAASNDSAYSAAISAASTAGGGDVLLPALLKLSTAPEVPVNVNLKGRGSSQDGGGSVVQLTAAGASVKFGNYTTPTSGGVSGGFHIDGQGIANIGLHTRIVVGRTFANIDVRDCADACQYVEGSQNNKFVEVNCQIATNDTIRVDKGSGSNSFDKCEYGQGGRYILNIVGTDGSPPHGLAIGPINNIWSNGCIFEYELSTTQAMVRVSAGRDNIISDSTIVSGREAPFNTMTLIRLEVVAPDTAATFKLKGGTCQFNFAHADTTVLNQSGASNFYQEGKTVMTGPTTIGRYDGASLIALWDSPVVAPTVVWKVLTGGAAYYQARAAIDITDPIAIAGPGTYTDRVAVFLRDGSIKWIHLYDQ